MSWLRGVQTLRTTREDGMLITVAKVRGHAPRASGAKMVVSKDDTWDTIGGGNLEEVAVRTARELLSHTDRKPTMHTIALSDKAPF